MPNTYRGFIGDLYTPVPPTSTAPPYPSTSLESAIQGLITPGLVPDIARMSAEVASGRGIGGSPAGASTAVKMSEQDYLQRLALANTLLSGEATRKLPYDITPQDSARIGLIWEELQRRKGQQGGGMGFGGGGGGAPAPRSSNLGLPGQQPVIESVYGTRGSVWGNTPGAALPTSGGGGAPNPWSIGSPLYGGGAGGGLWGGTNVGGPLGGPGGGGSSELSLDDIYEELGFYDTLPVDGGNEGDSMPPDFDWDAIF